MVLAINIILIIDIDSPFNWSEWKNYILIISRRKPEALRKICYFMADPAFSSMEKVKKKKKRKKLAIATKVTGLPLLIKIKNILVISTIPQ